MSKIEIHHQDFETGKFVHVANVYSSNLEYAWRWTNNIDGSWSRRDIPDNTDANDAVEVVAPLHVKNGKTYGLRSSMVGDIFILDGVRYVVASFGFDRVHYAE